MSRKAITTILTAVVVVVLAAAGTVAAQAEQRFDDVPTDHYAFDAINWMVDNQITGGCGDNNYCPDQPLTRAHLAAFLYRASSSTFSGVGDAVTDDLILEPGYYTVRVIFVPKAGYDWDDDSEREFVARFLSKSDGWTLTNTKWKGEGPGEEWNKHSDLWAVTHFRVDETGPHWFDIEVSGYFAWWAEVHRNSNPLGGGFD